MVTVAPGQAPVPQPQRGRGHPQQSALPLYDLFLDLPHPAASSSCPPPYVLGAPTNNAEMEKELTANLSRIARFAFPEFDDATATKVPKETALNRFSQYAMQPKTFQHYTFSLQLQSGVRLHGHVRRFLPVHVVAKSRYDVGRRGERALVILTRANGGDLVYSAILKTADALIFQKEAVAKERQPHADPPKWFLHKLFEQHRQLCEHFATLPLQERKPLVLSVDSIEVGQRAISLLEQVDTSRFLLPTSLLSPISSVVESVTSSSILPLIRVLGVQNTLRLLSALLSESRILLISSSPTRLAQCARSALSILAQGLLNWQHLYIPVLPPHLFQYLAAPVPYLIGMLTDLTPRLDQTKSDGLGEMVIINLDSFQMETRGINPSEVAVKIPDLFRTAMAEQGLPAASMSASEMLAQDLVDLLKVDKRSLYGESALTNVSETAAKATKAVKSGFLKLREKGKQFLKSRGTSNVSADSGSRDEDEQEGGADGQGGTDHNTMLPDYIYTQGAQNEAAEEEARIAFASFFLSLFGNMRWYLSASPGKLPQLDRKRFLQQKRSMGEGENTPVWPLLQNFCQTQMLEEFAKARVEEVRTRLPVTADSPLFMQCANYHRLHSIDFSVVNVRRVARQVAQNNPSRTILQTQARRTAMLLTSNRTFEGDYNKTVALLVEACRESSSALFDVMSVIWVRMRDSKGLHWKHGFQSLQILRNLLYHGPLAAIAEATDGLDKIRILKFYNDNMRSQICTQIRQAASQVYNLLVDRAKLFNIRRLCIDKRRLLRTPDHGRLAKDSRMTVTTHFNKLHAAWNPRSRAQVAPTRTSTAPRAPPQFAAEQDLLSLSVAASDPFASTPQPVQTSQNDPAQDILGLFDAVSISAPATAPPASDPFAAALVSDPFAAPAQIQGGHMQTQQAGQAQATQAAPPYYQPQPPGAPQYHSQPTGQHHQPPQAGAPIGYQPNQPYPVQPVQPYPPNPVQHPAAQGQPAQQYQHQGQAQPYPQPQQMYSPGQQAGYGATPSHQPYPQQAQRQAQYQNPQQQYYQQQPAGQPGQGAPAPNPAAQFDPFSTQ